MEFLNAVLQPLLEAVLTIVLPVALGAFALWVRQMIARGRQELEENNMGWLLGMARAFVLAAEQMGYVDQLENIGEAKKQHVIGLLQAEANRLGVEVNVDVLSAIVEAAVVEAFGFSESDEEPVG